MATPEGTARGLGRVVRNGPFYGSGKNINEKENHQLVSGGWKIRLIKEDVQPAA